MNWTTKILHTSEPDFSKWKKHYSQLEKKGIYHSPDYIRCLERHYRDEAELFIFGNEQEYIYYPYFKRSLSRLPFAEDCNINLSNYFDIISSWYYGGPLASRSRTHPSLFSEFTDVFSDYSRQQGFVTEFIRFDPNLQNHIHYNGLLPLVRNREAIFVDLKQTGDQIWMNMEGRARTAIRKSKNLGVEVQVSKNKKDVARFYRIYNAEMERKKAPNHYFLGERLIKDIFDTLGDKAVLIYAEVDGVFISAGIFLYEAGGVVHYFLMATDYKHFKYQANNLLLYEAMLYFKNRGGTIFDFQGGREGVYTFKKSFSKTRSPFYTCGVIYDHPVYDRLVSCRADFSSNAADPGSFFPAYRLKDTN